jgi:hypothetical protein
MNFIIRTVSHGCTIDAATALFVLTGLEAVITMNYATKNRAMS